MAIYSQAKEGIQPVSASSNTGILLMSIYLGVDMEAILVSLLLCIISCFIHQRMHNRHCQTSILLRKSVYHLWIYKHLCNGYVCYIWVQHMTYWLHKHRSDPKYNYTIFRDSPINLTWNVLFIFAAGVFTIIQAIVILGLRRIKHSLKKFCNKCCCCGNQE